ncbi:MAG: restriction endonuclease subunit S [Tyzzerella sp.]|nr:restriction endonuclease subunit S [Tyzzerella sp.]
MDTKKLRQKILDLAIHGKLVPQDPDDEPASVLLERIRAEKERLIKEGKIKKSKASKTSDTPHYENVPFEVPGSWEWTTVETVCSKIGSGSTPKGSNYAPDGILFFRSQNVYNDGVVLEDIKYISEEVHQSMIGTEVLSNDLLLNITGGSLGRCAIVPNEIDRGNVSQHVCILRPIIIKPEYLHTFILSSFFTKTMKITGSGREGLPKYNLEKMLLPVPPLAEQTRIIHELNKWNDWVIAIDNNQQDLVETIKQTKSKILDLAIHGKLVPQDENDESASELLKRINPNAEITCDNGQYGKIPDGWVWTTVNDISKSILYGVSESAKSEGRYKLLRITDIQNNQVNWETVPFTDFDNDKVSLYILHDGDIVFARTGATVGKSYLIKGLSQKAIYASYLIRVRMFDLILPEYVKHFFESGYYWEQIELNSVGIGQPNVNGAILGKLNIPLPPLAEQHRIVAKIEELFTSLDNIQKALEV